MNEEIKEKTVILPPFKHFIMTVGAIPTSYLESMTYYEMLVWFTNYLGKTVIPAINENGEAVTELQNLFRELQNYVNNYFDNLDVQDEINNKLDEMVEDGVLEQIIEQYLNSSAIWGFDNVADMKEATNLINGSFARTLGYHTKNDGGKALYKVRTITNDDIVDEASIIALSDDSLIAELITDTNTNIKQFGAYGDDTHDDTTAFTKYINYCNNNNININIPIGTYRIYEDLPLLNRNVSIIGTKGNNGVGSTVKYKSVISDHRNSNNYLIRYNQESSSRLGASIFDISFVNSSENLLKCIDFNTGGYKSVLENISFIKYEQGLNIQNAHATLLNNTNCYNCGSKTDNGNIYAIDISNAYGVRMEKCMIEQTRFMLNVSTNAQAFVLDNCYFEMASVCGYKGNSPIVISSGTITNNQFTTRKIKTIADLINDTIDNVYYFINATGNIIISNNKFSIGGANDGTSDNNKSQAKYLSTNSETNGIITNNSFANVSFETPGIVISGFGNNFSNNKLSITIEEELDNTYMDKYIIYNNLHSEVGENNTYYIIRTSSSSGQNPFIPKFSLYNILKYNLISRYNNGSTNDVYTYGYRKKYASCPTLVIQGTKGLFELEIMNVEESGLYYKALVTFNLNSPAVGINTTLISKLSGKKINFIKKDDKLLIQVTASTTSRLSLKVNNLSQSSFVYTANLAQESENILLTVE